MNVIGLRHLKDETIHVPSLCLLTWQFDFAVLLREPVIDGGEHLGHDELEKQSDSAPASSLIITTQLRTSTDCSAKYLDRTLCKVTVSLTRTSM